MDPNVTYENWYEAWDNNDIPLAQRAAQALLGWLRTGGFEPSWTPAERDSFYRFVSMYVPV